MSHRDRNENRFFKARKDPRKKAWPTKSHLTKTLYEERLTDAEEEMLTEVDEFFAEYMEGER
jgi:hypothetical protein